MSDEHLSFDAHIRPLFRERDHEAMLFAIDLWDLDEVRLHSRFVLDRLADGSMPCDAPWEADAVDLFRQWIVGGTRP